MKQNKTTGIIALMVAGGLLLSLFIGRWLQTEYTSAKMELSKDLFEQFMDANRRLTDSLIANKFITPILNDTSGFKINTVARREIDHNGDSIRIITSTAFGDSMPATIQLEGMDENMHNESFDIKFTTDSNYRLVQGVRLFISEMSSKAGEPGFFSGMMSPSDTVLLQAYFAANLDSNKFDVKPVWVSGRNEKSFPPPMFYYQSKLMTAPYGVEIQAYNAFILKGMVPEFISGCLLLLVITFAFIFSYRNIRNQMRLAVLKDDLISNISHELKTPVATVKVAIEAMQQMDPNTQKDKMHNYLGMAAQEISRLDLLVNKVMNSILLDNGKQIFQSEQINPVAIIEEAVLGMQVQAAQKSGVITFLPHSFTGNIIGDSLHIKGVLFNLIENSLKYSGENPSITIALFNDNSGTKISITDNGPGIPEAYLSKVFDKFFRVPDGNKHNTKGYGLGLYYAAQVMRASGGNITVNNNTNKGCTFTLTFPPHA